MKFLLRHGRRFTGTKKTWTRAHEAWLRAQPWPLAALTQTQEAYLRAVDEARARPRAVDEDLHACLTIEPLATCARRLRCVRGLDDLIALTIAAELSDARRFPTARSVMAYVGLIPAEHSSGARRVRGHITKTGNAHLRRVLIEAVWHYRHHPFVGDTLRRRQQGAPEAIHIHAWQAQQRLYHRYRQLTGRGKPRRHVVTAIGRELTGFLWATLLTP